MGSKYLVKRLDVELMEQVFELYNDNTIENISKKLNIAKNTVRKYIDCFEL